MIRRQNDVVQEICSEKWRRHIYRSVGGGGGGGKAQVISQKFGCVLIIHAVRVQCAGKDSMN